MSFKLLKVYLQQFPGTIRRFSSEVMILLNFWPTFLSIGYCIFASILLHRIVSEKASKMQVKF